MFGEQVNVYGDENNKQSCCFYRQFLILISMLNLFVQIKQRGKIDLFMGFLYFNLFITVQGYTHAF